MPMLKNARSEKLAQALVANCGDEQAAYKLAFAEASEGKSAYKIKRMFDTLVKKDAEFWRRVAELQKPVEEKIALNAIGVMNEWTQIALGDFTAITSVFTDYMACRTGCDEELEDASTLGPVCDVCGQKRPGFKRVGVADTADLTPAQRKLFISATQTKDGIKVTLRDPDAALSNIAKALGMFNEQYNITQTNIVMPPLPDDPVEAARVYAELVKGTV